MSKISLEPNASGAGTFTLAAPNSNTNRTLTLPDEAGVVLTDTSDLAADNLTGDIAADRMKDGFNATGDAPVYACRAWVNFDGTTTPPTIRSSGNVSSVTRDNTGRYTVNFSTAMPDNNFSATADGYFNTGDTDGEVNVQIRRQAFTTTSVGVRTVTTISFNNPELACVQVFR